MKCKRQSVQWRFSFERLQLWLTVHDNNPTNPRCHNSGLTLIIHNLRSLSALFVLILQTERISLIKRLRLTCSSVYERPLYSSERGYFITCCHLAGAGRIPHRGGEELSAHERRDQSLTAAPEEADRSTNKAFTVKERERGFIKAASSRPHHETSIWSKNRPMRAIPRKPWHNKTLHVPHFLVILMILPLILTSVFNRK